MRRMDLVRLTLCGLVFATGCSIHGKWQLEAVEPSAARGDFQYEVLNLEKDGSFYAEAREPARAYVQPARTAFAPAGTTIEPVRTSSDAARATNTTSGTYRYEDGVLALREHDGEEHTYRAKCAGANKMKITDTWKDRELVATFERVE